MTQIRQGRNSIRCPNLGHRILALFLVTIIYIVSNLSYAQNWMFGNNFYLSYSKTGVTMGNTSHLIHPFSSQAITHYGTDGQMDWFFDGKYIYDHNFDTVRGSMTNEDTNYWVRTENRLMVAGTKYNANKCFVIYRSVQTQDIYMATINKDQFSGKIAITNKDQLVVTKDSILTPKYSSSYPSIVVPHANGYDNWLLYAPYWSSDSLMAILIDSGGGISKPHYAGKWRINTQHFDQTIKQRFHYEEGSNSYGISYSDNFLIRNGVGNVLYSQYLLTNGNIIKQYVDQSFFDNTKGLITQQKNIWYNADGCLDVLCTKYFSYPNPFFRFSSIQPTSNDSVFVWLLYTHLTDTYHFHEMIAVQENIYTSQKDTLNISYDYSKYFQTCGGGRQLAISLGPDGNIYTTYSGSHTIDVLENPSVIGQMKWKPYNYYFSHPKIGICGSLGWQLFGPTYPPWKHVTFEASKLGCKVIQYKASGDDFTKYTWYFGDGDTGIGQTVNHAYSRTGLYKVALMAQDSFGGIGWHYESIYYVKPPTAMFSNTSAEGCQYLSYTFTDSSSYDTFNVKSGIRYTYDFGDGQDTSYLLDSISARLHTKTTVSHIYTHEGNFKATLKLDNGICTDSFSRSNGISILAAPGPGLFVTEMEGCSPMGLNILDTAKNVLERKYSYGNGNSLDSLVVSPGGQSNVILLPASGLWQIRQQLTGSTGCKTGDTILIVVHQGILATDTLQMLSAGYADDGYVTASWKPLFAASGYIANVNGTNEITVDTSYRFLHSYTGPHLVYVQPIDSCNKTRNGGLHSKTIKLTAENKDNQFALIRFTPYEGWANGIKDYIIESKKLDGNWSTVLHQNDTVTIIDSGFAKKNMVQDHIEKCYRIVAMENDGNLQHSISNEVCVLYFPLVYIPNAFSPNADNLNDYFAPTILGKIAYELKIYNRWGELVYIGTEKEAGWDGSYKGQPCNDDVFVYTIAWLGKKDNSFIEGKTLRGQVWVMSRR